MLCLFQWNTFFISSKVWYDINKPTNNVYAINGKAGLIGQKIVSKCYVINKSPQ